jgi:hypothetical protein
MLGTITDVHLMEMIVVQRTVIDPFGGCPVLIDLLPFVRTVGERTTGTDVIAVIDILYPSIGRGAAFIKMIAGIDLPCGERASVLLAASLDVVPRRYHLHTAGTDRDAILVNVFLSCGRICGM